MKRLTLLPFVFLSLACCQHEPTPAERYETALSIWTMEYEQTERIRRLFGSSSDEYKEQEQRLFAAGERSRAAREALSR